ncbi:response regulator [Desulforhopalus singaporensis]|uniref:Sensory/regulatory protein RpfC n=1 Tax=Desulforhopalus singaporensis TaxID=91360 RepID=A0A1H0VP99_9BACT|nr:response regulator [Desulforhopalus singaporensis]SDP80432.1 Signal transduction histidine kinase [Desulforhopalus singaporensis]
MKLEKDKTMQQRIYSRIQSERIRLVYKSTLMAIIAFVVAVIFLIYLVKDSLPPGLITVWGMFMVFTALFRLVLYSVYLIKKNQYEDMVYIRCNILVAAMTGLGWGSCAFFFFPFLSIVESCIVTLIITSYLAGGLTTLFPFVSTFSFFFFPASIPLIFRLFDMGGKIGLSLGLMLIVFVIFVTTASSRLRSLLKSSLFLRFNNEYLAKQLKAEKSITEQLNSSLATEVKERKKTASRLVTARKEAVKANEAKSEFLANMSHEIRTPMNSIIGMTFLALQTELSNKQRKYLTTVHNSAKDLLNIINDILDFSKIEAGKLEIESVGFRFVDIIDSLKSTTELRTQEKNITLSITIDPHIPPRVKGDPLRLGQVLINLTNNAIKFSKAGSSISLSVTLLKERKKKVMLHFAVKDQGIGMSHGQQKKIFKSFSQADSSTTRKYGGSGLGLVISKKIVQMMNGEIWVESELGAGSIFHFTVLLRKEKEAPAPISSPGIPEKKLVYKALTKLRGTKILLVEDNELNQELMQDLLGIEKIIVTTASNGQEALDLLTSQSFDGVLMDCQMPVLDGYETTRLLRRQQKFRDLPIIAMTANAMIGDKEKALAAGMNDHIAKPIEPDEMFLTMAKWMSANNL